MNTAFYTASSGTMQMQKGLDVIANNVANVSTTGYKTQEYNFSDMLYTNIYNQDTMALGHGTRLKTAETKFEKGTIIPTGRALDYAITDDNGFFAVMKDGQISYTRDGNFYLSERDGQFYLTSSTGGYVLDSNYQPMTVDPDTLDNVKLNMGVFSFSNLDGLNRNSEGMFIPTDTSGKPTVVEFPNMENYCLESSSVNLSDQMVSLIEIQRSFQLNTRMVSIADEVAQTLNSIR